MEILEVEPQIKAPQNPVTMPARVGGHVEFKDVTFNYPTRPQIAALDEFSISVSPGETVATVSPGDTEIENSSSAAICGRVG